MNIVLDTNVLLVAIAKKSILRPIFEAFLDEKYTLCLTTDILIEYEEIFGEHLGPQISSTLLQLLENANDVLFVNKHFKWNLIKNDPGDNKFVDCAIASDSTFIVSNDKHFNVLKEIPFPKVNVIDAIGFLNYLQQKKSEN